MDFLCCGLWVPVINRFKWALNAIMFGNCVSFNSGLGVLAERGGLWSCVCQRFGEPRDSLWAPGLAGLYSCLKPTHRHTESNRNMFVLASFTSWIRARLHQWDTCSLGIATWFLCLFFGCVKQILWNSVEIETRNSVANVVKDALNRIIVDNIASRFGAKLWPRMASLVKSKEHVKQMTNKI